MRQRAVALLTLPWLAGAAPGALDRAAVADAPSPLAANAVLMNRLLSPGQRERVAADLAAKRVGIAPYPLDTKAERFLVYVPAVAPPTGYGVLVFVPPWDDARLPLGWTQVLDRAGMILVTPARAGNDQPIVSRRVPLALTAVGVAGSRGAIDAGRIIVAGFSGGARVAERVAVAFPDVFSGVVLNAGSDPVGDGDIVWPPAALLPRLDRARFVFVTGADDALNLAKDADTRATLVSMCLQTTTITVPNTGHDVMAPSVLARALAAFDAPPARSTACRTRRDARLEGARRAAAEQRARVPDAASAAALDRANRTFGGLLTAP